MRKVSRKLYTYEDYMGLNGQEQYELLEGELFVVPSPSTNHQRVVGRLYTILNTFVYDNGLGEVFTAPTDVVFDNHNIFQPDILYISKERLSIIKKLNIQGAPDLVVEVLSPSTIKRDRFDKRRLYFAHGVKEYWIVDPDNRLIETFTQGDSDLQKAGVFSEETLLTSTLLPGLQLELTKIFETIT